MADVTPLSHATLLWCRDLRLFDSLDEAVEAAMWASDSDNDWVDRIEVLAEGEEPRIIQGTELHQLIGAKEAERRAAAPEPEPHVANVCIDGYVVESFYGENGMVEAQALVLRLLPLLAGRVLLRQVGDGRYVS